MIGLNGANHRPPDIQALPPDAQSRLSRQLRRGLLTITNLSRRDCELFFLYPVIALSILAYLFIRVNVPISVEPAAGHDDGLFFAHAYSILSGHWLGPYSQYTLMKGPGYALFLASISLFRLPETLAVAALNCVSVGVMSYMTKRVFRSTLLAFVTFELLLWDFGQDTLRASRETIYAPEFLLMFAFLILALFVAKKRSFYYAALAGFAFGWFWITREEGVLAIPTIAILGAAAFYRADRTANAFRHVVRNLVVFTALAISVIAVVAAVNFAAYGIFSVVDIKGNFEKTLEALESVDPDNYVPFVAVPHSTREKIYQVSPKFAELRQYLDKPSPVQGWEAAGCPWYPSSCGDYAGGWFMWALRDAVALDGQYKDARATSMFYYQMRKEIERACSTGTISCSHSLIPFMPQVSEAQRARLPSSIISAIRRLAFFDPVSEKAPPSLGPNEFVRGAAYFLNVTNYTPPPAMTEPFTTLSATKFAINAREAIIQLYASVLPFFLFAGICSFAIVALRAIYTRSCSVEFAVLVAALAGVLVRVAVLVLIDISSFPGITNAYISYAFPLLYFVCLGSIFLVGRWLAEAPPATRQAP